MSMSMNAFTSECLPRLCHPSSSAVLSTLVQWHVLQLSTFAGKTPSANPHKSRRYRVRLYIRTYSYYRLRSFVPRRRTETIMIWDYLLNRGRLWLRGTYHFCLQAKDGQIRMPPTIQLPCRARNRWRTKYSSLWIDCIIITALKTRNFLLTVMSTGHYYYCIIIILALLKLLVGLKSVALGSICYTNLYEGLDRGV